MCEITMKAIGNTYAKKKKICDGNGLYVDLGFDLGSRCPSLTRWDQTSEVPLSRVALESNFRDSSMSSRRRVETPCSQTSDFPLSRDALESNFRGSSQSRRVVGKLQRFLLQTVDKPSPIRPFITGLGSFIKR